MALTTVYSTKGGFPITVDESKVNLYTESGKYTTNQPRTLSPNSKKALDQIPSTVKNLPSSGSLRGTLTQPEYGSISSFKSLMGRLGDYIQRERPATQDVLGRFTQAGVPLTTPSAVGTAIGRDTERRLSTVQNVFQSSLDLIQEQEKNLERQRQENLDFGRQMFQLLLSKPELFSGVTAEEFDNIKRGIVPTELIQKITQSAQQPTVAEPIEEPSISEQLQAREKGFVIEEGKIIPEQMRDISKLPNTPIADTPEEFQWMINAQARETGIPASLISAVIAQESGFNPQAQNISEREVSYGLGQINLRAHPDITKEQAQDPQFAIRFVAERLKTMIDKYGLYEGVQAYNTPGAIGSPQLKNYADNILRRTGAATKTKEEKTPFDVFSDTQIALSVLPPTLKNSDFELKRLQEGITKGFEEGKTAYEIADNLMGYKINEPDEFSNTIRQYISIANLNREQIGEVARLINSGNKQGAITKIENNIMLEAKKLDPDNYIGESTVKTAVQNTNQLQQYIQFLGGESPVGVLKGTMEKWLRRFKSEEAQQIRTQIGNLVSEMRNRLSGTAVTKEEERFLEPLIPDLSDSPQNFMIKLNNLKTQPLLRLNTLRGTFQLQELNENTLFDYEQRVNLYAGEKQQTQKEPTKGRWQQQNQGQVIGRWQQSRQ